MEGGGGLGLFVGTLGGHETDALSGGRLIAAAVQVNSDREAGGKSADAGTTILRHLLEKMHPWLFLPYGHPKKTQRMRELQNDLKPLLEGFARGFIEADKKDGKSWIIGKGVTILSRHLQKNKKNKE